MFTLVTVCLLIILFIEKMKINNMVVILTKKELSQCCGSRIGRVRMLDHVKVLTVSEE